MLRDHEWKLKYTTDDGDLVQQFYVRTLENAKRYDRLTGYFNAGALALAARGIEGLVRNDGHMRLVVGCELGFSEIEAIQRGEDLRAQVERNLMNVPLDPPDPESAGALELLAWMVARKFLDVKIAVPCDAGREPMPGKGIFHEKAGIIEDRVGDRLAWTGSLNETVAGWKNNHESFVVFTSWDSQPGRLEEEELNFGRIWTNQSGHAVVLDVPEAVRRELMRFKPEIGRPARMKQNQEGERSEENLRARVWTFIREAPSWPEGGEWIGEATAPVDPWPHQKRAFKRLYENWPPRLLIADEVGLGKTIQAGLLLRQAWLAGRAKRILILAPKAVLKQWQIELREKFNLNWPIYDGGKLTWYRSPAWQGRNERVIGHEEWQSESAVIVSSQLMRRRDRMKELLEKAEPWDLVVLDEAHHARRCAAGGARERGPNSLLGLMRNLKDRAKGLLLLTATPMQMHPVEVWDLLDLLGLPPEWDEKAFLKFFETSPSSEAMERMAVLFQSTEREYGEVKAEDAGRLAGLSQLQISKVLRALRATGSILRRQLDADKRRGAIAIMRGYTPVRILISRNTRDLLRGYFQKGFMTTRVAERKVEDRFMAMTKEERAIYDDVEDYIASAYRRASKGKRAAVGFVMTIYRRRLASSFAALRETLHRRSDAIALGEHTDFPDLDEDLPDDDMADEPIEADEALALERKAFAIEQKAEIDQLLRKIERLQPDSKLGKLKSILRELRGLAHYKVMIFTQYTDTMDFLRDALLNDVDEEWSLLCFSGRGGEKPNTSGEWDGISRDEARQRFRDGKADILLCTDAAAEGLNFQFCGAVINYDMPWNPMRVEQRIGRIDRLGQENETIRIVNMHYEETIETDIYRALRDRIELFQSVVGRLQPILARLPGQLEKSVLLGQNRNAGERAELVKSLTEEIGDGRDSGFDIDAVTEGGPIALPHVESTITMDDLNRVIASNENLMLSGAKIQAMGRREYGLLLPGRDELLRVTTDPEYFEEHAESMEFWSPGNELFVGPESVEGVKLDRLQLNKTLKDILDGS